MNASSDSDTAGPKTIIPSSAVGVLKSYQVTLHATFGGQYVIQKNTASLGMTDSVSLSDEIQRSQLLPVVTLMRWSL